jgi:hypothetical protein
MRYLNKFNESFQKNILKKDMRYFDRDTFSHYTNLEIPKNLPSKLVEKFQSVKSKLREELGDDLIERFEKCKSLVYKLRQIEKFVDSGLMDENKELSLAPVYITQFKERNGELCFLAKMQWIYEDEVGDIQKKMISVYCGKADTFKGKNDPNLIKIAKFKMAEKILPNLLYY